MLSSITVTNTSALKRVTFHKATGWWNTTLEETTERLLKRKGFSALMWMDVRPLVSSGLIWSHLVTPEQTGHSLNGFTFSPLKKNRNLIHFTTTVEQECRPLRPGDWNRFLCCCSVCVRCMLGCFSAWTAPRLLSCYRLNGRCTDVGLVLQPVGDTMWNTGLGLIVSGPWRESGEETGFSTRNRGGEDVFFLNSLYL